MLHVFHDQAFGELQFQQVGRQLGAFQYPVDNLCHIALAELMSRQVHRNADIPQTLLVPLVCLATGALQHQFADGGNQPGFLGQWNEICRR